MDSIGRKLKEHFDSVGITQKEIAELIGVSSQYINAVFNDRKTLGKKNAEKLANLFGLSISFLLTGEGEMLASPSQQVIGDHNNATANNVSGDGNHVGNISTDNQIISKALDEIAAQRRLTEKAHEQIDRLLNIIEKMK